MPQRLLLKGKALENAIIGTCSIGFALLGFDSGVFGSVSTDPRFLEQFNVASADKSSLLSFIVSIYLLGCLAGALFMANYGERLGRRKVIALGAVTIAVGGALQATSFVLAHMLVARVVTGVGIGFATTALPVYQAECLPAHRRGRAQCFNLTMLIGLGINVAYWMGYGTYYVNSSFSWRFLLAFQSVYCVVLLVGIWLLPESPRWLASQSRPLEAFEVLVALRSDRYPQDEILAEHEDVKIALKLEEEAGTAAWGELFKNQPGQQTLHRVWIGIAAQAMQEFSGANAIIYYASYIFQNSLKLDRVDSLLVSGGLQIFFCLASLVPWYFIDRAGRRKLFIVSAAGMAACLLISAGCVYHIGSVAVGVVASISLYIFQAFFTLGFMANLWLYAPELLPLRHRARGNALACASQWLTTFAVVEWTPPLINKIGAGIYILFAAFNLVAIPIIYLFFPETAGKSLEEVDGYFEEANLRLAVKESIRRHKMPNKHLAALTVSTAADVRLDPMKEAGKV
ncbi:hypothetical protein JCM5296_004362 [Sporobolomyces johnsonii]